MSTNFLAEASLQFHDGIKKGPPSGFPGFSYFVLLLTKRWPIKEDDRDRNRADGINGMARAKRKKTTVGNNDARFWVAEAGRALRERRGKRE